MAIVSYASSIPPDDVGSHQDLFGSFQQNRGRNIYLSSEKQPYSVCSCHDESSLDAASSDPSTAGSVCPIIIEAGELEQDRPLIPKPQRKNLLCSGWGQENSMEETTCISCPSDEDPEEACMSYSQYHE